MSQSGFAAPQLQKALFANLAGNEELQAQIKGLYDEAPENALAPYISFGETSVRPYDTSGAYGTRIDFDLHIWSSEPGQMQAKELMALIDAGLTLYPLIVEGFELVRFYLESATVSRQTDEIGSLYRGRMRYRALLLAAEPLAG